MLIAKSPWQENDETEVQAAQKAAVVVAEPELLPADVDEGEGESLSLKSSFLTKGHPVTNALVTGWIVSLALIVAIRKVIRTPTLIPSRGQAFMESIIDGLRNLLEPVVGKKALAYVFPVLLSYFFFVLIHNWSGLFPGIGSIGFYERGHFLSILRPMNSDLNATLGIALVAMVIWTYSVLRCVGLQGFCEESFGNKAEKEGVPTLMYQLLAIVFLAVGCIECISIAFRPVSLSFRLFGNVFGGETLLHHVYGFGKFLTSGHFVQTELFQMLSGISSTMAHRVNTLLSWLGYFLPLPFYLLECLIGLIQASVFTLLVAVYIGLICHHEEEEIPVATAVEVQS
jgi:F-type H+-transporting ATPase subunit a